MLRVAEAILGSEEKSALCDVIESGWITMGDRVGTFEQVFARLHDTEDSVAVSSCTAALHLILAALDIGPGDEVLVPSLTFVASANAVLYTGATPVFIEIESLDKPLASLGDAAAKCTPRTKAIILVHYAGYVTDAAPWQEFARSRGLWLIEDAAHTIGIPAAGHVGDAAAFSFYGNKNITTAEGGAITARDKELLARIRQMRGHGMTSGSFQRLAASSPVYDVTMLGFNYRMDDLRAAIGLVQLTHLSEWNGKRKELTGHYKCSLAEMCPQVGIPFFNWMGPSSHHIMPVLLPRGMDRSSVISNLRQSDIQTTIHYRPVHDLSFYKQRNASVSLPLTEEFSERVLTLPLHPQMGALHVESVAIALSKSLSH